MQSLAAVCSAAVAATEICIVCFFQAQNQGLGLRAFPLMTRGQLKLLAWFYGNWRALTALAEGLQGQRCRHPLHALPVLLVGALSSLGAFRSKGRGLKCSPTMLPWQEGSCGQSPALEGQAPPFLADPRVGVKSVPYQSGLFASLIPLH